MATLEKIQKSHIWLTTRSCPLACCIPHQHSYPLLSRQIRWVRQMTIVHPICEHRHICKRVVDIMTRPHMATFCPICRRNISRWDAPSANILPDILSNLHSGQYVRKSDSINWKHLYICVAGKVTRQVAESLLGRMTQEFGRHLFSGTRTAYSHVHCTAEAALGGAHEVSRDAWIFFGTTLAFLS